MISDKQRDSWSRYRMADRNAAILVMRDEGVFLAVIAEAHDISVERVRQIVARERRRRCLAERDATPRA